MSKLRKRLRKSRRYLLAKRREAHEIRDKTGYLGEYVIDGVYHHLYAPAHVQRVMRGEDPVRPQLISNGTGRPV